MDKRRECATNFHCEPCPYSCYGCPFEIMVEVKSPEEIIKSRDEEIKELKQHISIIENTCMGLHFPAVEGSLEMHKYIEAMNKIEKLEKILREKP